MDNDDFEKQDALQMALCDVLDTKGVDVMGNVNVLLDILCDVVVIHNLPGASTLGHITTELASKIFAKDDEDDPLPF
jgi:hypothetical protein